MTTNHPCPSAPKTPPLHSGTAVNHRPPQRPMHHILRNRRLHPSHCFYVAVWGVVAGTIFSLFTKQTVFIEVFWLIAAGFLFAFSLWRPTYFTLFFALLAGFIFANFRTSADLIDQAYFTQISGATVTISGSVSEDPDLDSSPSLRLDHLRLQLPTSDAAPPTERELRGVLYVRLSSKIDVERSDIVTLRGSLGSGFGTFVGTMYRPQVISIEKLDPGDPFAKFKNFFASLVRGTIPSPEADLGLGYLMGLKTGLSDSFSDALRAVGMTHVVVASGAHLSILTGAVRKLFGKVSKFSGLLFSLLMILAFALVVGFTPSMTRASLVAGLSLLVGYVGRKFTPVRLIGFVAMITLLLNPTHFFNLGWQLSFASFFGILVVAPRLQKVLYGGKNPPWLASMLLTSIATTLTCAPVLIYNFGTLSLLSLIANLIILPTLPYAMLLVLLTGAASFCSWLAHIFGFLATWLLRLHIWIVEYLSQQKMLIMEFPTSEPWIFLLYLPILLFLLYPSLRHTLLQFVRRLSPRLPAETPP